MHLAAKNQPSRQELLAIDFFWLTRICNSERLVRNKLLQELACLYYTTISVPKYPKTGNALNTQNGFLMPFWPKY